MEAQSAMEGNSMKQLPGMFKGLGVTAKTMLRTLFPDGLRKPIPQPTKGAHTVQYPHEKETPAPRARGVIALHTENCTSCMLCARECPDWCIYIEGHKALAPPPPGRRQATPAQYSGSLRH